MELDLSVSEIEVEAKIQVKDFTTLGDHEQIERLLLLLDFIVEILEQDLAVFLVKRSCNLKKPLLHSSYMPVAVSTVWRTSLKAGIGHMNQFCKMIINLYIKYHQMKYDFQKTSIVSVSISGQLSE
jgi:hypothetical protein